MFGRAVKRLPSGDVRLALGSEEREVLRSLPEQLREVLTMAPDSAPARRLRPPAYSDEPAHDEEYRRLMGDDLRERQLAAVAVLEETVSQDVLSEEQAQGWLAALNSLRLVLGTQLDVSEDMEESPVAPDDPRAPGFALYGYLSWLLGELVDALASGLPEVAEEDDGPLV